MDGFLFGLGFWLASCVAMLLIWFLTGLAGAAILGTLAQTAAHH